MLFRSVEALIGKRPFEEKKSLVVEEATAEHEEKNTVVAAPKKEAEKSTDELPGNIGLAPSI